MQDGIIAGNGNSRYLKTVAAALSLYPDYETFMAALIAGTFPIDLNGVNPDGWKQQGTALNKANLLADSTATSIGLDGSATVDTAVAKLKSLIDNERTYADTKTISELKSYVGTGTYGASNPTSLSFSFTPLFVIFIGYYAPKAFGVGAFNNPYSGLWMIPVSSLSTAYRQYFGFCLDNTSSAYGKRSADSNTAYWYSTSNATEQLNASGQTYYFLAIGRK